MIDVITAFLAAEGVPALLLLYRIRQSGLSGSEGVTAALMSIGPGGALGGLVGLALIQLAMIPLVMCLFLVYFHWAYRRAFDSCDATCDAVEEITALPLSALMRYLIMRHVTHEFMRHTRARAIARKKRDGLMR